MQSNGEAPANNMSTRSREFALEKALNDQSSPYFLQSSDNPGVMVVEKKLLGEENYTA